MKKYVRQYFLTTETGIIQILIRLCSLCNLKKNCNYTDISDTHGNRNFKYSLLIFLIEVIVILLLYLEIYNFIIKF